MKKLTNDIWKRLKLIIILKHPDRMHSLEWDCTGNRHDSECWCITETIALARELGYSI